MNMAAMRASSSSSRGRPVIVWILFALGAMLLSLLVVVGLLVIMVHEVHVEEAVKGHKHPHTSLRSTGVGSNSGEGQVISARPESEKVVNIDWRAPGEGEGGSMLDSFNVKDVAATRSADSVIESEQGRGYERDSTVVAGGNGGPTAAPTRSW